MPGIKIRFALLRKKEVKEKVSWLALASGIVSTSIDINHGLLGCGLLFPGWPCLAQACKVFGSHVVVFNASKPPSSERQ